MSAIRRITAPIVALDGNIVASEHLEDLWAVFRLEGQSYGAESLTRREAIAGDLERFAQKVQADFQILRVSRRWEPESYVARLRRNPPPNAHRDLWDRYLAAQFEVLSSASVWAPQAFLAVRLADPGKDTQQVVSEMLGQSVDDVKERLRDHLANRRRREEARYRIDIAPQEDRIRATERRVTTSLRARRATEEEVQWLIRRVFARGLAEPRIVPAHVMRLPWNNRLRSAEWWLDEHLVGPRSGGVEITDGFETRFQAAAVLGEMDDAVRFTRESELLFTTLEEFNFPIDASLNVRWQPSAALLKRARSQYGRNKSSLEEMDESNLGALENDEEEAALAREHHGHIHRTKEPGLWATLVLSVVAEDRKELQHRIRTLKEELPHFWHSPAAKHDQLQAAFQCFPGQRSRVTSYERLFTSRQIGAMVPHASHQVGADAYRGGVPTRAMYFARTIYGDQPVFFDLNEAWETDQAPTIALIGSLGGGKTLTMLLLEYQAFVRGARVVDVDPKGDHRLHRIPEVAARANEIVLGPHAEHRGKLDPLRVAPENERHTAATTFLDDVIGNQDSDIRSAIHGAIGRVIRVDNERACCTSVIAALHDSDDETDQKAALRLRHYADGGIVALGFARPEDPLPAEAAEQFTYLNVRALDAPHIPTVRSEMSAGELHSRAVMQLVALYAMRILGKERAQAKFLGFDETSFIRNVGARLLDQLARWSRSEKAQAAVSTQMLRDVAAQDNLIGYYLLFGMTSREQASEALAALELDPDGPLASALTQRYGRKDATKGECLFRDIRSRSEEIRVDPGDLLDSLRTSAPADERINGKVAA